MMIIKNALAGTPETPNLGLQKSSMLKPLYLVNNRGK